MSSKFLENSGLDYVCIYLDETAFFDIFCLKVRDIKNYYKTGGISKILLNSDIEGKGHYWKESMKEKVDWENKEIRMWGVR